MSIIVQKIISLILSILMSLSIIPPLVPGQTENNSEVSESVIDDCYGIINKQLVEARAEIMTKLLIRDNSDTFNDATKPIAQSVICAVLIQIMAGNADENAVYNLFNSLPHEDIDRTEAKATASKSSSALINKSTSKILSKGFNNIGDAISAFFNSTKEGINDLYIYFADTEYEGVYLFMGNYVKDNGEIVHVDSGVYYDSKTGLIYGKDNNGIFAIGFDYDTKQYVVENPINGWQRTFGFNIAYDYLAEATFMDCETIRLKFKADGKNWMFQLWKGAYTSITNGGEIGMYYLPEGKAFQYSCATDDDMLIMSMQMKYNGNVIFTREPTRHWWLSGYKVGPAVFYDELLMDAKICFESEEMKDGFIEAAKEYSDELAVQADGLNVSFQWQ